MDPMVAEHVAKKDPSLWEQYQKLAGDTSEVDKVRDSADRRKMFLGIAQGLAAYGGADVDNSGLRKEQDGRVAAAEGKHKQKLADLLMGDKLKHQDVLRDREAKVFARDEEKFGRETKEYNELNDPKSNRSVMAATTGSSRALQLANEASRAGDKDGAKQFLQLSEDLKGGKYSAEDIGKMQLLDKVDYKDILNNQAAMSRLQFQESQANKRSADSLGAEKRRLTSQEFKMYQDLTAEIDKDPLMRQAVQGKAALDNAMQLAEGGGSVGDEGLLVMWQKGLDPTSVVREGEFARTTAAQGLLARLEMAKNKALGQGIITPELRTEIVDSMRKLQAAHQQYADAKLRRLDNKIDHFGLDKDLVYGEFHSDVAGRGTTQPAAPAPTAAEPGAVTKQDGGFPRTLTRKNPETGKTESATVSDSSELQEAQAEGFK